ncbi:MAG: polysaccharide biosynthesis tyrosine autokinase [Acidobacteria bacterium]|nr:polysaccharide biosynthesis tyrosine autokinase [Acidobacteriota bacterium]MBI3421420.1 polysaccharide biosynthesis tyrosine autokinase [Acidobacteriota bacterium]
MSEESKGLEKFEPQDESLLARPVTATRLSSLNDEYGYNSFTETVHAEGLHARELARILRKRKWLVLAVVAIITSLVTIEIHRTPSTYQAAAQIEVTKDIGATTVSTKDFVVQSDDADNINTKLVVIKSRPLLEDVVVNLKLDQNPNFLNATRKRSVTEAMADILHKMTGGAFGAPLPAPVQSKPTLTERSEEESARLSPYVNTLKNTLNVSALKDTRVIEIAYNHSDPQLAAAIVNSVANNFIDRSFERKTQRFSDTSEWLKRSTAELKAQVEKATQALADYTKARGIFTTEGKESLPAEKLSELHSQVMKAETERMLKQSVYEEVKQGRVAQLPDSFSDPQTGKLQEELGKLEVQSSELSVKYGPENPRVAEVQQKIQTLKSQVKDTRGTLAEKLRADYERSVRDELSLKNALAKAKSEAVEQNQNSIQYDILKSQVDTAKQLYTDFLNKTNQANLAVAEQHNNLRMIEPAEVPASPIGPQRLRTILLGFLVSLAIGMGLAFFLEYLDNTVKSVEDVHRIAGLPTLAVIPAISDSSARAMKLASRKQLSAKTGALAAEGDGTGTLIPVTGEGASEAMRAQVKPVVPGDHVASVMEAYRMLRTSVLLSTAGNPPKTILFTSSQPGDGKTTTSVNTAISLAQLGSTVLLIDADLRRPSVHRALRVDKSVGLSSFLSSGRVALDEVVQHSRVPKLDVLTCGPIPPNPAELVASERMRSLLQEAAARYEHVIIDSPPLMHVTDPVILSTMVDGVILVVQSGRSTRDIVRRARQELVNVGAKVFGVVLNNFDMKREGYSNDYSYYRSVEERIEAGRARG